MFETVRDKLAAAGCDPIEVMIRIMNGDAEFRTGKKKIPAVVRLRAAEQLAQFCYPRHRAIDVSINGHIVDEKRLSIDVKKLSTHELELWDLLCQKAAVDRPQIVEAKAVEEPHTNGKIQE